MAGTMRDTGSAFSFTTTRGHTTHISILWVFVLFCFLTVAVVLLGGYQEGLMKREFPETKVNGDLEVTGSLDYAKGGAVTQATSKATAVTLNQPSGQITMNNAALAAGVEVSFTVNNDKVTADDVILVNHASAGTAGSYFALANNINNGSFGITVGNTSAAPLSEAIVLHFVVIRATTA
jgi:hypothetical protein